MFAGGDIIVPMQSNLARIVIGIALMICIVCPVVEMFDHWDNTLQTGNDTEYALVILSLCIGSAFSIARLILTISHKFFFSSVPGFSVSFLVPSSITFPFVSREGSPPPNLRI